MRGVQTDRSSTASRGTRGVQEGDGVCDEALNCLAQAFDGGDCAGAVGNCGNWECERREWHTCPNDCMAYVTLYLETQCSSDFDDTSACLYSNQIEDFQTCAPMQPTNYAGVFTFSDWFDVSKTFEYIYGATSQGELALLETSLDMRANPSASRRHLSGQGRLRIDPDANMNYYDTFGACEACSTECGDGPCWGAGESPISCPSDCAPNGLPLSCASVGQAPVAR